MTLFWGRDGTMWEPKGGEWRAWRDLLPGDLIARDRKIWRVREVRPVPVADWDETDREYYRLRRRNAVSEEDWPLRPVYLIVLPVNGGERHHVKALPYAGGRAWVLSPHYPVCRECGEPWPCRELDITQEVRREAEKIAELEKILPGCCWSCGEPVTHRQSSIVFDGDNLLLPGAAPPVFHLRSKGGCLHAAVVYEKRWVQAAEGRRCRLSCPGNLILHLDGHECSEDPFCPGRRASHSGSFMDHRYGNYRCLRCADEAARRALGECQQ
jgi:hypothetical protein